MIEDYKGWKALKTPILTVWKRIILTTRTRYTKKEYDNMDSSVSSRSLKRLSTNRNRLTDIEDRFVTAKEFGAGGEMDWVFGISRCKLLHIKYQHINNKILLFSTWNYIQYLYPFPLWFILHKPECKKDKKCIHMYDWITLLYSRK